MCVMCLGVHVDSFGYATQLEEIPCFSDFDDPPCMTNPKFPRNMKGTDSGCLCYVNLLFSVHSFYVNWQGYICINVHITIHYLPSSLNKAICALALTVVASTSLLLCHSLQATSRTIRISCSFCLQVGIAKLFFYHVGKSTFDYTFQQGVWCPYVFALI